MNHDAQSLMLTFMSIDTSRDYHMYMTVGTHTFMNAPCAKLSEQMHAAQHHAALSCNSMSRVHFTDIVVALNQLHSNVHSQKHCSCSLHTTPRI